MSETQILQLPVDVLEPIADVLRALDGLCSGRGTTIHGTARFSVYDESGNEYPVDVGWNEEIGAHVVVCRV